MFVLCSLLSRRLHTMSNPTDDALLTELATYQNRKLLLW
jgi:hypothetical protein